MNELVSESRESDINTQQQWCIVSEINFIKSKRLAHINVLILTSKLIYKLLKADSRIQ